ncbi:unnamed protein product [Symbiodinium natans]|uniref:Uncharacterized protein n=1 Tax=Symbiodinium natans TaxID=878477 RepID=A0A812V245_9DINO|nr:unnamed protein product [Symbiodinium natans]
MVSFWLVVSSLFLLAEGVDWLAWIGDQSFGHAGDPGWQKLDLADRFKALPWEEPGKPNGYRYFYPHATEYTLGEGCGRKMWLDLWQPFSETAADAAVGANLRGALYTLFVDHLTQFCVKVSNKGWDGCGSARICEEGEPCPNVILNGDNPFPRRIAEDRALPLNQFLEFELQHKLKRYQDDFLRVANYMYNFDSKWMGIPFAADTRLLGFNVTTLKRLGLKLPPPFELDDWTWEDLVSYACKIKAATGQAGLLANSDWDEDAKFFLLMLQGMGGALLSTTGSGAARARTCGLRMGTEVVESFWKPMVQKGCLGSIGGGDYWLGSSNQSAALEAVLGPINPLAPPDVKPLSNYNYELSSGRLTGFFIANGLEERVGRCELMSEQESCKDEVLSQCKLLARFENRSQEECKDHTFALGGDSFLHSGACQVLSCETRERLDKVWQALLFHQLHLVLHPLQRDPFCHDATWLHLSGGQRPHDTQAGGQLSSSRLPPRPPPCLEHLGERGVPQAD